MSEPSIVVRCPHCGHPYPLTDLQREVYRGRTMGCVNCGRPIHVDAAIAAQFPVVTAGAEVGSGVPSASAAAVVSLTAGIVFVVLVGMAAIAGYVAADAG